MKYFLLLLCCLLLEFSFTPVRAQSSKGEIKGRITEDSGKKPLAFATVSVYTAQDTVLVTFRLSDEKGAFKVPSLPLNKNLRLLVTLIGYGVYRKEFTLTPEQTSLDMGTIDMGQSASNLDEILIEAEAPPIVVRKDTLEFNANSFKTLPTALVEDLLKKLPGVTVDASGNIKVNGKPVNKILVDGKEFFGSDPKIASQNLPSNMVDKVQVVNDPDALRRDPDMPASDIPQVINLKLKKGIKQGAFGKVYAGGGTDSRYEAGGILNIFRDTTQLSVLGYRNNVNRAGFGFNDIRRIGGFDRSGINMMMMSYDGGYAINGISFGGLGSGIQTSSGGGGNFNTLLSNGIKLNLQYFYGGMNNVVNEVVSSAQTVSQDEIVTLRRNSDQKGADNSHRIGGRMDWKIDSLTNLSISPGISFNKKRSNQNNFQNTFRNYEERINESTTDQELTSNNTTYSSEVNFERSGKKKGRNFTFSGNYEYTTFGQDQLTNAINQFFQPEPQTTFLNQLRDNDQHSFQMSNMLAYTEPITKTLSAVARLSIERFTNENAIQTYDRNPEGNTYDQLDPTLSDQLDRKGWRNYLTTGLKWKVKDFTFQPGVRFTKLDVTNAYQKQPTIKQDFFFVFPSVNVNWKELHLTYNVELQEPSATDLQSIQDNTNPLVIYYGNPALQPSRSHSISLNYWKNDVKHSMNYSAWMSGSIQDDAVTHARTLDENGVQTYRPVNTDGFWNFFGHGSVSKDYKTDNNRQFSLETSMSIGYDRVLILFNNLRSYGENWNIRPSVSGRINLNDKFEFSQSFSQGFQRSHYESETFQNLRFNARESETGFVLRVPKKLVWEANLTYRYNSNTAPGLRKGFSRLNLGVTYLFMKDDRAQLKLFIFDALDDNFSAYRSIQENYVQDYQSTVLTRYAMLSFTYNIRNFGGKVGSTSNSLFRF